MLELSPSTVAADLFQYQIVRRPLSTAGNDESASFYCPQTHNLVVLSK